MKPAGSITKPDPSEVTRCGALDLGPRKFLNKSSSGEPGGRSGICCGEALRVWEVAIFTTDGSSLAARSAKESGAPRAAAALVRPIRPHRTSAKRREKRGKERAFVRGIAKPSIPVKSGRKQGARRIQTAKSCSARGGVGFNAPRVYRSGEIVQKSS